MACSDTQCQKFGAFFQICLFAIMSEIFSLLLVGEITDVNLLKKRAKFKVIFLILFIYHISYNNYFYNCSKSARNLK